MGLSLTTILFAGGVERTRLFIGVAVMIAGVEMQQKLTAIRASAVPSMPYVPHWPSVAGWHPTVPLIVWGGLGAAVAAGLAPRFVGALLVCSIALLLLGDQRTYSNHLYFVMLLVGLLAFASHNSVVNWPITLLKSQATILYGFGALSKLTVSYASGWMIAGTIDRAWFPWIPQWNDSVVIFATLAILTIVLEAWLAVALWMARLRAKAVVSGVALHLGCLMLLKDVRMDLLVFGLGCLGLYPLFLIDGSEPAGHERPLRVDKSLG